MNARSSRSLSTKVAWLVDDDHLWFGLSVGHQLCSRTSFGELMTMAVHGKRLEPEQVGVIDDVATVLTAADPRIWPMKIIRVAASYGRPSPAMAVGHLVLQTSLLGPATSGQAARYLLELDDSTDAALRSGVEGLLARDRRLAGFGVAFRDEDERLRMLRECMSRRGRTGLRFWQLGERMARIVMELRSTRPNIGLGTAAALLDIGLEPEAIRMLTLGLSEHMRLGNAVEGARQAPELLQRLPLSDVRYDGASPRVSPRARAAR